MRTFVYSGQRHDLFDHEYNATILNERAVEIPIALDFVKRQPPDSVGLEVGNVLAHYGVMRPRRIVDLNERAQGVENIDLFTITGRYDWLVCISTIEHVRQHENQYAGIAALAYLAGLVRPQGHALVTAGMGQNPGLDLFLTTRSTAFGLGGVMLHRAGRSWRQSARAPLPYVGKDGAGSSSVWIGER